MKKMKIAILLLALALLLCACNPIEPEATESTDIECGTSESDECSSSFIFEGIQFDKPVIYLYPEEETEISVTLRYEGELVCTYPEYENGWRVLAKPDGALTNLADGMEYSYLFWEGVCDFTPDLSHGYCIAGKDTASFLRETLSKMGLSAREINDFIVYWLPQMQKNPYNLITFQTEIYTDIAALEIIPAPDSILRVFMAYVPLEAPVDIEAPEILPFERNGFTVVEWGGTVVEENS